jgi:hypothetical protein
LLRSPPRLESRVLGEVLVFSSYLLGAAVFTYPLALDLRRSVTDLVDPLLNSWTLAWLAHQLPRDPLHLFDANIFFPEKGTLAFSEHLIGIGLFVWPLQALLEQPVASHNLALLFSIAFSGYATYRLVRRLTGSGSAGLVSGSLFAFAPYRLNHLAHLQLQATGFIPLLFLALGRYLEEGGVRNAFALAGALWFTSASCGYYGVFTWVLLALAVPLEILRTGSGPLSRLSGLGLALALTGLATLPLARPYLRLDREFGFRRPLERVQPASARPPDYLRSNAHLHRALGLPPAGAEQALFPGLLAVGLAATAILQRNRRAILYLCLALAAAWASLGPAAGLYRILHEFVPGVSGLRVPARFAIYLLFGLAVLAGWGAGAILERLSGRRRVAVALGLSLFPLAESFGGPVAYTRAPIEPPEIYRWLAAQPDPAPIAELPLPAPRDRLHLNALYMLWSTGHWKPMVNGYSAFVPPLYGTLAENLADFKESAGFERLQQLGVRYVILHRNLYLRERALAIERVLDAQPGLRRVARTSGETAYQIVTVKER